MLITMSTSSAPSFDDSAASRALAAAVWLPEGNPHTVATLTPPRSSVIGSIDGDTHTENTPSSRASATSAETWARVASVFSSVWSTIWASAERVISITVLHSSGPRAGVFAVELTAANPQSWALCLSGTSGVDYATRSAALRRGRAQRSTKR